MPLFLTGLIGKVVGKVSGGLFGYLGKRGERQVDLDTAGVESLNHSRKDEITLATFYMPIWMFLLGSILIVVGWESRGRILIDTAKETITFLDTTLSFDSLYGQVLFLIVLVSLGLSRLAANWKVRNGRGRKPGQNKSDGVNSADVFKP